MQSVENFEELNMKVAKKYRLPENMSFSLPVLNFLLGDAEKDASPEKLSTAHTAVLEFLEQAPAFMCCVDVDGDGHPTLFAPNCTVRRTHNSILVESSDEELIDNTSEFLEALAEVHNLKVEKEEFRVVLSFA